MSSLLDCLVQEATDIWVYVWYQSSMASFKINNIISHEHI